MTTDVLLFTIAIISIIVARRQIIIILRKLGLK